MFGSIIPILKEVLRLAVTTTHGISADNDGFGPTVTSHAILDAHEGDSANARRIVIETCISLLSIVPVLGSASGEPTRDKDLTSLVLDSSDESFFLVATVFFSKVRQKILGLNTNNFNKFLSKIGLLVTGNYFYSRREEMLLLLIHFLRSTLPIWLQDNVSSTDNANGVRDLLHWLSNLTTKQLARSWRVRDAIAVFMGEYLVLDPLQKVWSYGGDHIAESQESNKISLDSLPVYMLPQLAADADIRVRFRAAVVNSRLFSIAQSLQLDRMDIYAYLLECLTKNLDE
jgi:serine-protein kinase ATM